MTPHLRTLDSLGRDGIRSNLELAAHLKTLKGQVREAVAGGRLGLIFDKPSTRTRVSFEAAAFGLGMLPITLRPDELQLGRGETIADTARVLSRYLSAIAIRTFEHSRVDELAHYATIPIINALTDDHHPCQALADVMTLREEFYTDVWPSRGEEKKREERARLFAGYRVDTALMALASTRAIFLHCLPAHRGDEVTDEVIDGPQSRVWDEAENRWYTEQALLYTLITGEQRWEQPG